MVGDDRDNGDRAKTVDVRTIRGPCGRYVMSATFRPPEKHSVTTQHAMPVITHGWRSHYKGLLIGSPRVTLPGRLHVRLSEAFVSLAVVAVPRSGIRPAPIAALAGRCGVPHAFLHRQADELPERRIVIRPFLLPGSKQFSFIRVGTRGFQPPARSSSVNPGLRSRDYSSLPHFSKWQDHEGCIFRTSVVPPGCGRERRAAPMPSPPTAGPARCSGSTPRMSPFRRQPLRWSSTRVQTMLPVCGRAGVIADAAGLLAAPGWLVSRLATCPGAVCQWR